MIRISILIVGAFLVGITLGQEFKSTKIGVSESSQKNLERVLINVQTTKIEKDDKGNFKDAEILKVSLIGFEN